MKHHPNPSQNAPSSRASNAPADAHPTNSNPLGRIIDLPSSSTSGNSTAGDSGLRSPAVDFSSAPGMALTQNLVVDEFSSSSAISDSVLGPSLATGMSRDPANSGGEHEAVTALSNGSDLETLIADTGTSPGACGTERGRVGALNSRDGASERWSRATSSEPRAMAPTGGDRSERRSTSFSSVNSFSGIGSARDASAMLHPGVVDGSTTLALQAGTVVTAGETAPNSFPHPLDIPEFLRRARPAHDAIKPELVGTVIPIASANNVATGESAC